MCMTNFHLPFAMLSQARIVPLIVEYDAFWTRYFYRLHRLEQKHAQFQQLTQRTLAAQEVEEVRWALPVPCCAVRCSVPALWAGSDIPCPPSFLWVLFHDLQCKQCWNDTDIEPPRRNSSYTWAAIFPSQVGWGSDEDEEQSLAAASPISTAPSLPAAAPPGAAQQTAQAAAQQAAGREAGDGYPTSSALPAEEVQGEPLQEGEQAEAAEAAAAEEQPLAAAQEAVTAREIPVVAGTACPAVTISSDTSAASGEHWQVVTSPDRKSVV